MLTFSTPLPLASVTLTRSGAGRLEPTVPTCPSPLSSASVVGASGVAVAVKGTEGSPENTALRVKLPTVGPSVHRVTAYPSTVVIALTGLTTPAPDGTTQVTVRPPTPLPLSSRSRTTSESGSWNPAGAV